LIIVRYRCTLLQFHTIILLYYSILGVVLMYIGNLFPPPSKGNYRYKYSEDENGHLISTQTHPFEELIEMISTVVEVTIAVTVELTAPLLLNLFREEKTLTKGDVIGVKRGLYEHYGVFIGDDRVIHYTSLNSDVSAKDNKIIETHMDSFMRDADEFFILDCTFKNIAVRSKPIMAKGYRDSFEILERQEVFSPEETVIRAKSRLGETEYKLLLNNCEHFAIWCKTGIGKSHQVDKYLSKAFRLLCIIIPEE
jgi:hypothetical protein